jgi:hypothetical protein
MDGIGYQSTFIGLRTGRKCYREIVNKFPSPLYIGSTIGLSIV